ncbi:hypothetical protein SmJEL517_g03856 [Synchytrium microbalum]|uniref:Uncharacterized protein n=1 Tax=Synchytrium microbalum TaxID=1806994 RepID=A0A507C0J3_9FUNG|nr:uncharacterized protein SmJEL517_g03856 [Synchytrium microbalum]TPX33202.1 hypothetical protein SmJEL517_g03856 [Synchytrium microbalum]
MSNTSHSQSSSVPAFLSAIIPTNLSLSQRGISLKLPASIERYREKLPDLTDDDHRPWLIAGVGFAVGVGLVWYLYPRASSSGRKRRGSTSNSNGNLNGTSSPTKTTHNTSSIDSTASTSSVSSTSSWFGRSRRVPPIALPDSHRRPSIYKFTVDVAESTLPEGMDPELIRRIVNALLESKSDGAAGGGGVKSALPVFEPLIAHLLQQIKTAKVAGRPLLVEGGPGIGKGTALQRFVTMEGFQKPAIYLKLAGILDLRTQDQVYEAIENGIKDETADQAEEIPPPPKDAWRKAVEVALGFDPDAPTSPFTTIDDPSAPYLQFAHIAHALRLIRSRSPAGPTLIAIDDVQLLFENGVPRSDVYDDIESVLQWLLACEAEGFLDVILCGSEKSVLQSLKRCKGYEGRLSHISVEAVDDELAVKYLISVNPLIHEPSRRFNEETAATFVATFDCNLTEVEGYVKSDLNCEEAPSSSMFKLEYIRSREVAHLAQIKSYFPESAEGAMRDLVLEMITRNGILPVNILPAQKLRLAEELVERGILRWRDSRIKKRERAGSIGRSSRSVSGSSSRVPGQVRETNAWSDDLVMQDLSPSEEEEDEDRGPCLVYMNRLISRVLERWFSDQPW